jgi:CRP-like cAMP-binding protein
MQRLLTEYFNEIGMIEEITLYSKKITYSKGETIFYGNQLMDYFYIVLKGSVKTYQLNINTGKEQTIFIFNRGDMFDVIILLDEEPHDVMYEAFENVELMQLPISKVREWITTKPEFNKVFFPHLAKQMRHTEELATDLALHSTQERLIKLILKNLSPNKNHKFSLIHNLSHIEIAKLLGTVRQVVERHLGVLKNENAITINKDRHIEISNIQKLLDKF